MKFDLQKGPSPCSTLVITGAARAHVTAQHRDLKPKRSLLHDGVQTCHVDLDVGLILAADVPKQALEACHY